MARPFTGKRHVGERREKRPNGDIYVYERITAYDQKTQKTRTVSEHLKGKIKAGTSEIVATRYKSKKGEDGSRAIARTHTGVTDILEWAGRESGIDADVMASFDEGEARKLLSIARYWVATDGASLPRLESWQNMHDLPYPHGISEDVYSDLFKSVGQNEDGVQSYFLARARRLSPNPVIALDSTTISTYSENQLEARRGFNKDHDGLPTIKYVTAYSEQDEEPIAYAKQPGNIPDVISVENALRQLEALGVRKPLMVTDAGYCSEHNLMEYTRRNMKFLTIMDATPVWIRQAIDAIREEISRISSVCPFDLTVSGAKTCVEHEFHYIRQRSRNGISAGETVTFTRRLYLYVFYSGERKLKRSQDFRAELLLLKRQLEEGQTEFTKAAEKRIEKYLVRSRTERGGHLRILFNDTAIQEAERYFGFFVLVSNQSLELFKALSYYRLREKIEEFFADVKESFDGRKPRVWYPDNLRGRQFAQFIGLGYHCFIAKMIRKVKNTLEISPAEETAEEERKRKKLLSWLDSHSFAQIMDWFDCIETTTVKTDTVQARWSTETTEQDRRFLKPLGVIK